MVDWEDLCKDSEGWGPLSSSRAADFTPCFEDGVLLAVPNILLLVFGAYRLHVLSNRFPYPRELTHNWHYYSKITLVSLLLAINSGLALSVALNSQAWFWDISVWSAVLGIFATIMALFLHRAETIHSRLSSTVLLIYYIVLLFVDGFKLHTLFVLHYPSHSTLYFSFLATSMVLVGVIFALENLRPFSSEGYTLLDVDPNECPEETANIFSRITFSWMTPLMKSGFKKYLTMDDLWNLNRKDESRVINEEFERNWEKELKKKNPSLLRAVAVTFGGPFAFAALFKFLQDILQFTQPNLLRILMGWVASYATDTPQDPYRGYLIAGGMFLTALLQTAFLHQYFQLCFVTGMRVRAGLVTAIYKKSLSLSANARQGSTVGEIVNLMSVDAQRFMDLCTYLHIVWSGPLQIILALYFLYRTMGIAIFAGVIVMLLMIPINTSLAKHMRTLQKAQMNNKDSRIKLMNEILNGIRVIKLYAWESTFLKKIFYVRNECELETLKKIGLLSAAQGFTWASAPFLVSLSSFAVFIALGTGVLTSEVVFVSLSLFNLLQFPLNVFPNVISSTVEASVSLYRMESFLTAEELDPNSVIREPMPANPRSELISIQNGKFSWNKDSTEAILSGINLSSHKGELVAIVGRVGSGKSSLISAILGNMRKAEESKVVVRGNVAYVPQQAWIMNATVRENIIFGHRFDKDFYEQTIEACCLKPDLAILAGGDLTEIGERGINLSGGQKARISLARAVYARADIYLLDDPLSAVDAHVGRSIFDNVIGPNGILRSKCRLLVTHGISFLPKVDTVIMLRNGKINVQGRYDDLMRDHTELYDLITEYGQQAISTEDEDEDIAIVDSEVPRDIGRFEEELSLSPSKLDERPDPTTDGRRGESFSSNTTILRRASVATLRHKVKKENYEPGKEGIIMREESAVGSVKWDVYKAYIMSSSLSGVALYIFFLLMAQGMIILSSLFLKYWSSQNDKDGKVSNVWAYLGIYAAIGLTGAFFTIIQTIILWVWCAIRSARVLHNNMLEAVMRSPMSFFDTTPLGRILNRFSKDQYTIDEVLPRTFSGYFRTLFNVIATVAVICFSTPWFIVLIIPMAVLYTWIQRYYLATSRELKRLDSVSRSPIYAQFQESLGGVSSIRAYLQQDRFIFENEDRLDENQKAYFASISSNRWLAVRLEFLGSITIFGAAIFAVLAVLSPNSTMDAGLAGLSVSFALSVTQSLNWCVRQFCEIETNIVSVERVEEYVHLPPEAPDIIESNRPSPFWPDKGLIEYKNYATRYRPGLDLVLKGVSFKVNPKEKIGIVGRTGAGKSSLTLSLFRIVEAAKGTIFVDGMDIAKIGLHDLRSRLTIIPQDPVLFAGTVRDNLDPFNAIDDIEIWRVLKNAHLKDHIVNMDGKLNATVFEGGENFSVGQRQLICLARALLRRTSILILDEATAAIDVETDAIIQETIRREFVDCTILTIAHRINTVLDSDKILVLDDGKIAEYDTPQNLLAKPDSLFYSLAKEAGHAS